MNVGWIILAVYVIGYIALWRTVAYFFATDMSLGRTIDGEALFFGVLLGSLVTFFWPLIALGLGVRKAYAARGGDINAIITPRSQRRRIALDERERRIASLERDLGIR